MKHSQTSSIFTFVFERNVVNRLAGQFSVTCHAKDRQAEKSEFTFRSKLHFNRTNELMSLLVSSRSIFERDKRDTLNKKKIKKKKKKKIKNDRASPITLSRPRAPRRCARYQISTPERLANINYELHTAA
ncbi:hypothetical protein PUN28_000233 [Cardiocondyla obscurior]|uniref:Uncharacterized protein n=1 Tax=Cardiocondyla obscurior TaxID=286306 RepID=A0AAW2GYD4_9HYME